MKTQTTLLILFVSFLTPVKASADPFVFNVAATTSGVFTCLSYSAPIVGYLHRIRDQFGHSRIGRKHGDAHVPRHRFDVPGRWGNVDTRFTGND